MVIVSFVLIHWLLSIFCQTFFLHRYGAHRMFTMSKGWERTFHLMTYLTQGLSYLDPRGYAILHRQHHAFSDTKRDPHSPLFSKTAVGMMLKTKHIYDDYAYDRVKPEPRFEGGTPEWKTLDKLGQNWGMRALWIAAYIGIYAVFATAWWQWLLLPVTMMMGILHGAIVNWCGHKYGYVNFDNHDASKNTLFFDFVTMGELFQNNHHKYGMSPNFAARWFEVDPCYQVMRVLAKLGIIDFGKSPQQIRPPQPSASRSGA